eukprot:CAMPEP_0175045862 /NCGR_PEP_ID=MMETSP0052_2-20121109/4693_1 /TAXON_ID=51329 ORGANISM="Polytomella parva, Strain SAG 63-3" /NCGR_SAMPLE_ID=MMETSP0052_2 /ASSEMBLY_ACC=CAM_ASM_000194 /LENGTH=33 /DNA_ID= /DNA_START= /DNA_END= /DNA_ORIENTATION=
MDVREGASFEDELDAKDESSLKKRRAKTVGLEA